MGRPNQSVGHLFLVVLEAKCGKQLSDCFLTSVKATFNFGMCERLTPAFCDKACCDHRRALRALRILSPPIRLLARIMISTSKLRAPRLRAWPNLRFQSSEPDCLRIRRKIHTSGAQ